MVRRLRPAQERILLAGPPPSCEAFGRDFIAWYAEQDRWYASAVDSGKLPAPNEKQRRVLWQQATKRFTCAQTASRALDGDANARASKHEQTAQRRWRKRLPPLKRWKSPEWWSQFHRERTQAGLTRRIPAALLQPVPDGAAWDLERPPRLAQDFANDRAAWEHARSKWFSSACGSELPADPDARIAAWDNALHRFSRAHASSEQRESKRERKHQCELLKACADTLRMRPPSWDDGTDFVRKWRCRDVPMINTILAWERQHEADGTDAWWRGLCRAARSAQTVKQPLSVAVAHGVYMSGGPFKEM